MQSVHFTLPQFTSSPQPSSSLSIPSRPSRLAIALSSHHQISKVYRIRALTCQLSFSLWTLLEHEINCVNFFPTSKARPRTSNTIRSIMFYPCNSHQHCSAQAIPFHAYSMAMFAALSNKEQCIRLPFSSSDLTNSRDLFLRCLKVTATTALQGLARLRVGIDQGHLPGKKKCVSDSVFSNISSSHYRPSRDIHYRSLFHDDDEDSRAYNRRYQPEGSYGGEHYRPKSVRALSPPHRRYLASVSLYQTSTYLILQNKISSSDQIAFARAPQVCLRLILFETQLTTQTRYRSPSSNFRSASPPSSPTHHRRYDRTKALSIYSHLSHRRLSPVRSAPRRNTPSRLGAAKMQTSTTPESELSASQNKVKGLAAKLKQEQTEHDQHEQNMQDRINQLEHEIILLNDKLKFHNKQSGRQSQLQDEAASLQKDLQNAKGELEFETMSNTTNDAQIGEKV